MSKRKSTPLNIATDLLAGVFVGFFIGFYLDNFFESKPLCIIIFTIIGILASMRNIYKEMRNNG